MAGVQRSVGRADLAARMVFSPSKELVALVRLGFVCIPSLQ